MCLHCDEWFSYFCIFFLHSEFDGILLDYSRQQATLETKEKLFKLAEVSSLLLGILRTWFIFCNLAIPPLKEKKKKSIIKLKNYHLIIVAYVIMQVASLKQKINRMYSGEHVSSYVQI